MFRDMVLELVVTIKDSYLANYHIFRRISTPVKTNDDIAIYNNGHF